MKLNSLFIMIVAFAYNAPLFTAAATTTQPQPQAQQINWLDVIKKMAQEYRTDHPTEFRNLSRRDYNAALDRGLNIMLTEYAENPEEAEIATLDALPTVDLSALNKAYGEWQALFIKQEDEDDTE